MYVSVWVRCQSFVVFFWGVNYMNLRNEDIRDEYNYDGWPGFGYRNSWEGQRYDLTITLWLHGLGLFIYIFYIFIACVEKSICVAFGHVKFFVYIHILPIVKNTICISCISRSISITFYWTTNENEHTHTKKETLDLTISQLLSDWLSIGNSY